MRIRRYNNPFRELDRMMREFAGIFQRTIERDVDIDADFVPRVDIWEDDINLNFEFELPGVKKEEIKISLNEDGALVVSGEKKLDPAVDGKVCCRSERAYGKFYRSFMLPEGLNTNKIKASYENGILRISIAKVEQKQPKEQEIEIL